MTGDEDDDDATGVPERTERADAGAPVTESGRVATNRNVVPRDRGAHETSGLRDLRALKPPGDDDEFDVVTPVRALPRDVFEEVDAARSAGGDARFDRPANAAGPRITPADAGFTPPRMRRPSTERMDHEPPSDLPTALAFGGDARPASDGWSAARAVDPAPAPMALPRSASARITPADVGFIPPESRRPGSDVLPLLDPLDPRRPSTARGHIEPRRRPTTPPPTGERAPTGSPALEAPPDGAAHPLPGQPPALVTPAGPAPPERAPAWVTGRPIARPIAVSDSAAEASLEDRPYARPHAQARGAAPRTTRRIPAAQAPDADPAAQGPSLDDRPGRDPPRPVRPLGPSPHEPGHGRPDARRRDRARRESRPGALAPHDRRAASPQLDGVLRGVTILGVLVLGVAGLAQPTSVLRGGLPWLGFLMFVLSGWGAIVVRLARISDPDAGQRTALGAAGLVAVAGLLVALELLTQPVVLGLIGLGFLGFAWRELTTPTALWQHIRHGLGFVAERPALAAFAGALAGVACVRLVGSVAALDRSPWADDVAYTPLLKRLLDTGDLIEPFSFRRLGAYGGQTALQALVGARGSLASVHLLDKGLGFAIALLGIVGYARERRTQPVWVALLALAIVLLPDTAIDTASYWTGVVAYLALYRAVVREQWAVAGLVGAMACTLHQNFLATTVVFLACVLIIRFVALARTMPVREAWQQERGGLLRVAGTALAAIAPWLFAACVSSHTFLFPVLDGTWNHQLSLPPAQLTWPAELALLVTACVEAVPLVVIPALALVLAFAIDRRPGRPLSALAIASALSLGLLVHGLASSDTSDVWRHAFGFSTVLAIALVLELGADDDSEVALPPLGRWVVLAALVLQIVVGRGAMPAQAVAVFDAIGQAAAIDRHGDGTARLEQRRYAAMQAAVPAGARLIVMLDDPAMLDYRRNPIANLDIPGWASPDPQLPAFAGAEPLRAYLVAQGYRYAAFVRPERSRCAFRREPWVRRLFDDRELFQIMGAYTVDAIDGFAELATTTRVMYDAEGLVVLDLATVLRPASRRTLRGDEPSQRGAWARELADREGMHDAWSLSTRADVRFEDGLGAMRYIDATGEDALWSEAGSRPAVGKRTTPVLPMSRRAHLRVRGTTGRDMRLVLRAASALDAIDARPRLDVSLDGELVASGVADATGRYAITATVARHQLTPGWHDLYLTFATTAEPDREVRDPRIAGLESVEWWSPP